VNVAEVKIKKLPECYFSVTGFLWLISFK